MQLCLVVFEQLIGIIWNGLCKQETKLCINFLPLYLISKDAAQIKGKKFWIQTIASHQFSVLGYRMGFILLFPYDKSAFHQDWKNDITFYGPSLFYSSLQQWPKYAIRMIYCFYCKQKLSVVKLRLLNLILWCYNWIGGVEVLLLQLYIV